MLSPKENSRIQGLFKAFECFSSTFQGKFYFQGLFKTVIYIQVLFKPVPTLSTSLPSRGRGKAKRGRAQQQADREEAVTALMNAEKDQIKVNGPLPVDNSFN